MEKMIRNIIRSTQNIRSEEKTLLKFLSTINISPHQSILDIGCGYGEKLKLLRSHGYGVTGIDMNASIIKLNREKGLNCMTVDEFQETDHVYDVLLMAHFIEHFSPDDLFHTMDMYLDRLKPNGHLIIASPLYSSYFHDDFDHIKPYHPTGINMVFGGEFSQVKYFGRNQITLEDLWFRKGPFRLNYYAGLYLPNYSKIPVLLNTGFAILFRISLGMIGKTDGWMGLYRKKNHGEECL